MAMNVSGFYKDQNVFITGGSGFLGRVLIEKLLRSCPNIGNIYLLLREKKGMNIMDRVTEIVNLPLFRNLEAQKSEIIKKIIPIPGDCMNINLGISESNYKMLEENVSIVFHCAASVRFNDTLKKAIIMNVRGTRETMLLARKMKNLKVFVHVSTCYCHCDKKVVEERMYPAPVDWRKYIEIAETVDEEILTILTKKIIDDLPNTYVFSKSLAEHVVDDLRENVPAVIVRPSIVTSTLSEPFPGWIDNWNGPVALVVAGIKGVLRTMIVNEQPIDIIPVDTTIKISCAAACEKSESGKYEDVSVYNIAAGEATAVPVERLVKHGEDYILEHPIDFLWIPCCIPTKHKAVFYFYIVFMHLIPASIIDFILRLRGAEPRLLKITRKMYYSIKELSYFSVNSWIFENYKMLLLGKKIASNDEFNLLDFEKFQLINFLDTSVYEACILLLNCTPGNSRAKRNLAWMLMFQKILKISAILLGIWFLFVSEFLQIIFNYAFDIVHSYAVEIYS
ncbi:hypothetical protein L9F63_009571 [Diploptera punctata]|uniref:Fatty acyl-CoA reductase n=1 Tax=Diploptera punctata TaxID=6984 RepID=A0AAD8ERW7_DIPPU|nr:hypothetical protein L9F63_009571 [Diploptera punctata]